MNSTSCVSVLSGNVSLIEKVESEHDVDVNVDDMSDSDDIDVETCSPTELNDSLHFLRANGEPSLSLLSSTCDSSTEQKYNKVLNDFRENNIKTQKCYDKPHKECDQNNMMLLRGSSSTCKGNPLKRHNAMEKVRRKELKDLYRDLQITLDGELLNRPVRRLVGTKNVILKRSKSCIGRLDEEEKNLIQQKNDIAEQIYRNLNKISQYSSQACCVDHCFYRPLKQCLKSNYLSVEILKAYSPGKNDSTNTVILPSNNGTTFYNCQLILNTAKSLCLNSRCFRVPPTKEATLDRTPLQGANSMDTTSTHPVPLHTIFETTSTHPDKTSKCPDKTSKRPDKTSKRPDKTSKRPDKTSKRPDKTSKRVNKTSKRPNKTSKRPAIIPNKNSTHPAIASIKTTHPAIVSNRKSRHPVNVPDKTTTHPATIFDPSVRREVITSFQTSSNATGSSDRSSKGSPTMCEHTTERSPTIVVSSDNRIYGSSNTLGTFSLTVKHPIPSCSSQMSVDVSDMHPELSDMYHPYYAAQRPSTQRRKVYSSDKYIYYFTKHLKASLSQKMNMVADDACPIINSSPQTITTCPLLPLDRTFVTNPIVKNTYESSYARTLPLETYHTNRHLSAAGTNSEKTGSTVDTATSLIECNPDKINAAKKPGIMMSTTQHPNPCVPNIINRRDKISINFSTNIDETKESGTAISGTPDADESIRLLQLFNSEFKCSIASSKSSLLEERPACNEHTDTSISKPKHAEMHFPEAMPTASAILSETNSKYDNTKVTCDSLMKLPIDVASNDNNDVEKIVPMVIEEDSHIYGTDIFQDGRVMKRQRTGVWKENKNKNFLFSTVERLKSKLKSEVNEVLPSNDPSNITMKIADNLDVTIQDVISGLLDGVELLFYTEQFKSDCLRTLSTMKAEQSNHGNNKNSCKIDSDPNSIKGSVAETSISNGLICNNGKTNLETINDIVDTDTVVITKDVSDDVNITRNEVTDGVYEENSNVPDVVDIPNSAVFGSFDVTNNDLMNVTIANNDVTDDVNITRTDVTDVVNIANNDVTDDVNIMRTDVTDAVNIANKYVIDNVNITRTDVTDAVNITNNDVIDNVNIMRTDVTDVVNIMNNDVTDDVNIARTDVTDVVNITNNDVNITNNDVTDDVNITRADVTDAVNIANNDVIDNFNITRTDVTDVVNTTNNDVTDDVNITRTDVTDVVNITNNDVTDDVNITRTDVTDVVNIMNNDVTDDVNITRTDVTDVVNITNNDVTDDVNITRTDVTDVVNIMNNDVTDDVNITRTDVTDAVNITNNDVIDNVNIMRTDVTDVVNTTNNDVTDDVNIARTDVTDVVNITNNDVTDDVNIARNDVTDVVNITNNDVIDNVSITRTDVTDVVNIANNDVNITNNDVTDDVNITRADVTDAVNIANNDVIDNFNITRTDVTDVVNITNNDVTDDVNIARTDVTDVVNITNNNVTDDVNIMRTDVTDNVNIANNDVINDVNITRNYDTDTPSIDGDNTKNSSDAFNNTNKSPDDIIKNNDVAFAVDITSYNTADDVAITINNVNNTFTDVTKASRLTDIEASDAFDIANNNEDTEETNISNIEIKEIVNIPSDDLTHNRCTVNIEDVANNHVIKATDISNIDVNDIVNIPSDEITHNRCTVNIEDVANNHVIKATDISNIDVNDIVNIPSDEITHNRCTVNIEDVANNHVIEATNISNIDVKEIADITSEGVTCEPTVVDIDTRNEYHSLEGVFESIYIKSPAQRKDFCTPQYEKLRGSPPRISKPIKKSFIHPSSKPDQQRTPSVQECATIESCQTNESFKIDGKYLDYRDASKIINHGKGSAANISEGESHSSTQQKCNDFSSAVNNKHKFLHHQECKIVLEDFKCVMKKLLRGGFNKHNIDVLTLERSYNARTAESTCNVSTEKAQTVEEMRGRNVNKANVDGRVSSVAILDSIFNSIDIVKPPTFNEASILTFPNSDNKEPPSKSSEVSPDKGIKVMKAVESIQCSTNISDYHGGRQLKETKKLAKTQTSTPKFDQLEFEHHSCVTNNRNIAVSVPSGENCTSSLVDLNDGGMLSYVEISDDTCDSSIADSEDDGSVGHSFSSSCYAKSNDCSSEDDGSVGQAFSSSDAKSNDCSSEDDSSVGQAFSSSDAKSNDCSSEDDSSVGQAFSSSDAKSNDCSSEDDSSVGQAFSSSDAKSNDCSSEEMDDSYRSNDETDDSECFCSDTSADGVYVQSDYTSHESDDDEDDELESTFECIPNNKTFECRVVVDKLDIRNSFSQYPTNPFEDIENEQELLDLDWEDKQSSKNVRTICNTSKNDADEIAVENNDADETSAHDDDESRVKISEAEELVKNVRQIIEPVNSDPGEVHFTVNNNNVPDVNFKKDSEKLHNNVKVLSPVVEDAFVSTQTKCDIKHILSQTTVPCSEFDFCNTTSVSKPEKQDQNNRGQVKKGSTPTLNLQDNHALEDDIPNAFKTLTLVLDSLTYGFGSRYCDTNGDRKVREQQQVLNFKDASPYYERHQNRSRLSNIFHGETRHTESNQLKQRERKKTCGSNDSFLGGNQPVENTEESSDSTEELKKNRDLRMEIDRSKSNVSQSTGSNSFVGKQSSCISDIEQTEKHDKIQEISIELPKSQLKSSNFQKLLNQYDNCSHGSANYVIPSFRRDKLRKHKEPVLKLRNIEGLYPIRLRDIQNAHSTTFIPQYQIPFGSLVEPPLKSPTKRAGKCLRKDRQRRPQTEGHCSKQLRLGFPLRDSNNKRLRKFKTPGLMLFPDLLSEVNEMKRGVGDDDFAMSRSAFEWFDGVRGDADVKRTLMEKSNSSQGHERSHTFSPSPQKKPKFFYPKSDSSRVERHLYAGVTENHRADAVDRTDNSQPASVNSYLPGIGRSARETVNDPLIDDDGSVHMKHELRESKLAKIFLKRRLPESREIDGTTTEYKRKKKCFPDGTKLTVAENESSSPCCATYLNTPSLTARRTLHTQPTFLRQFKIPKLKK